MEQQAATRRISMILGHLASGEDLPSLHLFPMNCSSTINSTMGGRCDNRLLFARQGSAYQAYHMKQQSMRQNPAAICGTEEKQPQKSHSCASQKNFREPMFSRQAHNTPQCRKTIMDPPRFSRSTQKEMAPSPNGQFEWAPRMDAVDMGQFYALTVELAGVKVSDIQVEVDDNNLTVMGQRSMVNSINGTGTSVHRREISRGPYRLTWRLPHNVNKDAVSAKFMDGILHVTIPKYESSLVAGKTRTKKTSEAKSENHICSF